MTKRDLLKSCANASDKSTTYRCPYANGQCPLNKHCHVITTAVPITAPIQVRQLCEAAGKGPDGHLREITITIGLAA